METSVKERLTGALILVAALVVLVPEMLSGPHDRPGDPAQPTAGEAGPPLRTYNLVLDESGASRPAGQSTLTPEAPGVAEQAAAAVPAPGTAQPDPQAAPATSPAATADARAARADVPPAAVPPSSAPQAERLPTAVPPPAAPPSAATAPVARPAAPAPATSSTPAGRWWTQLGSFSSRDNAERLARELRGRGFTIDVSRIRAAGKDLYRVRAGPVADREAAVALQSRLASAGHKSSLVAP